MFGSPGRLAVEERLPGLREELGVDVEIERIVGVYGGPHHRFRYANGDEVAWVVTIFAAQIVSGTPAASGDEVEAVGWVGAGELGEGLAQLGVELAAGDDRPRPRLGDVAGALVGGASLDVDSFKAICETAGRIPS